MCQILLRAEINTWMLTAFASKQPHKQAVRAQSPKRYAQVHLNSPWLNREVFTEEEALEQGEEG